MNISPYERFTPEHLQYLFDGKPKEDRALDYKRDLPTKEDELLKDVSAFANTQGGVIVFGVQEKDRVPEKICPVHFEDEDRDILRMSSWIRANLDPSLSEFYFDVVDADGGKVVALRIPQSPNAPHMIAKGSPKFYARGVTGNTPMDAHEIRSAFLASESLVEKVENFRAKRSRAICGDDFPINLEFKELAVFHIIPLSAIQRSRSFSMTELRSALKDVFPLGNASGCSRDVCLEGAANIWRASNYRNPVAYVLLHRTGILESACPWLTVERDSPTNFLSENRFMESLASLYHEYMGVMRLLTVTPPFLLCASFINVRDAKLSSSIRDYDYLNRIRPFKTDEIRLPAYEVNTDQTNIGEYLRVTSDFLANAAGLEKSTYFRSGN